MRPWVCLVLAFTWLCVGTRSLQIEPSALAELAKESGTPTNPVKPTDIPKNWITRVSAFNIDFHDFGNLVLYYINVDITLKFAEQNLGQLKDIIKADGADRVPGDKFMYSNGFLAVGFEVEAVDPWNGISFDQVNATIRGTVKMAYQLARGIMSMPCQFDISMKNQTYANGTAKPLGHGMLKAIAWPNNSTGLSEAEILATSSSAPFTPKLTVNEISR